MHFTVSISCTAIMVTVFRLAVLFQVTNGLLKEQKAANGVSYVVELTAANVSSNLVEWDTDLAIMFMAPWCKYCKQLMPTWQTIATLTKDTKDLTVGTFNCEGSPASVDLCKELVIAHYPSLLFIGYGNFNQGPKGAMIGRSPNSRVARFVSDLYPEAVYDWVSLLSTISSMHRRWDDVVGFFSGQSRMADRLHTLKQQKDAAEKKALLFGQELERYKANELFDSLEDNGDPFPLMHSMEPDEKNLPLRTCVGEMAAEFCKFYNTEEKFCKILDQCMLRNMEAEMCRPASCPFENNRGCIVTSMCMKPDVIQQYKAALTPQTASSRSKLTSRTASGASGSGNSNAAPPAAAAAAAAAAATASAEAAAIAAKRAAAVGLATAAAEDNLFQKPQQQQQQEQQQQPQQQQRRKLPPQVKPPAAAGVGA